MDDFDSDPGSEGLSDILDSDRLPKQYRESAGARAKRIRAWYGFGENLFIGRGLRLAVIDVPTRLEDLINEHPLHPALRSMGTYLVMWRRMLASPYREVEEDLVALDTSERPARLTDFTNNFVQVCYRRKSPSGRWKVRL